MENKAVYAADKYAQYRPTYPEALFTYIYQYVNELNTTWDCGCGNGQAANELAKKFRHVIATDVAEKQITHAIQNPKITYAVAPAEHTDIADHSIDLITVAQAMHWFDHDAFSLEVKRVLKPKGILAAWGYSPPRISQKIDTIIDYAAFDLLENYWADGREYLNNRYRDIPFPLKKIKNDEFYCSLEYDLNGLIGYLESWSPRLNYMKKHNKDPLDLIKPKLASLWGNPNEIKMVKFPVFLLLGING